MKLLRVARDFGILRNRGLKSEPKSAIMQDRREALTDIIAFIKLRKLLQKEGYNMVRKALVVGIDDYGPNSLSGCCNDANSISDILRRNADENETPNFDVNCITVPRGSGKTLEKGILKSHISNCFSDDSDIALFYFSGHGSIDACGGYLVTTDYYRNDFGVSMNDILTIVNDSKCKNRIVILDCCHGGFMGQNISTGSVCTTINEGVTILSACKNEETSVEINGHGIFTSLLLEALSGMAADLLGHITPGSVYAYIDRALGPWDQRPVFKTNITRFISLRDVKPPVDIKVLRNICNLFTTVDSEVKLDPSFEYTNSNDIVHEVKPPYADSEHVKIFKQLQMLEGVGLVIPNGEEHMYWAAMHSKSCALTSLGKQYWLLAKKDKF